MPRRETDDAARGRNVGLRAKSKGTWCDRRAFRVGLGRRPGMGSTLVRHGDPALLVVVVGEAEMLGGGLGADGFAHIVIKERTS